MATRVPALIQLSDPRVAAQLVTIIGDDVYRVNSGYKGTVLDRMIEIQVESLRSLLPGRAAMGHRMLSTWQTDV